MIIFVQEGQRRIPIQYANRVRGRRMYQGGSTFLPLRVNMAGVIPIIFADQHPAVPVPDRAVLHRARRSAGSPAIAQRHRQRRSSHADLLYVALYFLLTVAFAFFYTAFIVFKPDETAEQPAQERRLHPGHQTGCAN